MRKRKRIYRYFIKDRIPNRLRTAVVLRDNGICQNCGKKGKIRRWVNGYAAFEKRRLGDSQGSGGASRCGVSFEIGHIIPESKGGETILENLILLCRRCNRTLGTKIWQPRKKEC